MGEMPNKSHNHGSTKDGMIKKDFGKDNSAWTGKASDERGGKMGGSTTNLAHSLGTSMGRPKGAGGSTAD